MNANNKVILYIAVSLDGYIAREDGSVDWLDTVEVEGDGGYSAFYDSIDTVIMGNKTYEHTKILAAEYPYPGKRSYVYSRTAQAADEHVQYVNGDPAVWMQQVREEAGSNIWLVGGAELLDAFMKVDLVDEFIVAYIPVILGSGIPLFKPGNAEVKLQLKEVKQYGQMAQLHYVRM